VSYPVSLHDALPICAELVQGEDPATLPHALLTIKNGPAGVEPDREGRDREERQGEDQPHQRQRDVERSLHDAFVRREFEAIRVRSEEHTSELQSREK